MTDTNITTPPTVTSMGTGTVTREQQRRNNAEQDAIEDGEKGATTIKKKEINEFKGLISQMNGHVFQLAEEGRKGNQYTKTMEALMQYVNKDLEHAKDLAALFDIPSKKAEIKEPPDQPPLSTDGINRVTRDHRKYIEWKFECESYNERKVALESNQRKLFTVMILQCSPSVKMKVEGTTGYESASTSYDCTWLITTLKNICHRFEHTENRFVALVIAKAAIFNYRQGQNQSVKEYFEAFKELLAVLESYGGKLHDPPKAAPDSAKINDLLTEELKDAYMRDRYSAILFLRNADNHRFAEMKADLSNDFGRGRDEYPTSLTEAMQMLQNYTPPPSIQKVLSSSNQRNNRPDGGRGGSGRNNSNYRGGGRSGRTFVQVAMCLTQVDNHFPEGIPDHYVLLDSDSTVSIFCNSALLTNIHEVDTPLYLETNGGGHQVTTQMGTLEGFGQIWYNPDSIANVLSLAQVRKVRRVTMDTNESPAFHVHKPDGSGTTLFYEHESGLYLHDASTHTKEIVNNNIEQLSAYSCLQTVAHNKTKYTIRQVEAADAARKLYRLLGRPGYQRFLTTLRDNHILNCPITVDDARRAELIYGKDIAFLKGKTTASPAKDHVIDYKPIDLPSELLSLHPNVTLCFDLFYVLGIGFSLSTSREIKYLSSHHIADRTKNTLRECISRDLDIYRNRGFTPTEIHADGEYNALAGDFPNTKFTICSAEDHVPEIERAIRTVKENIRATIHGMPYARLPRVMVKELIQHTIRTLNMLPHADGVSNTMSPATIVTGYPKTDYRTLNLEFGTYVQVYDGTSNETKSRTLGAISLNPTGNSSGDYYFMSLATGQRIQRRSWTIIPISDLVISRVEAIASNENMPTIESDHMLREYDLDATVDDDAYDRNYQPGATDGESDHELTTDAYTDESDLDDDDSGDDDDDLGHHPDFDDEITVLHHNLTPQNSVHAPVAPPPVQNEERVAPPPVQNEERVTTLTENEERTNVAPTSLQNEERTPALSLPNNEERPQQRPIGLRPQKLPNYQYRYGFTQTSSTRPVSSITRAWRAIESTLTTPTHDAVPSDIQMRSIHKAIVGLMFTQMSAQKGIKKHGQQALNALRKEFLQFKALDVLEPLDAFTLTDEQKAEALRALSVIKEKRDGSLKGRTCADGSTQQGKYSKSETGSPTISNDALFLSIMIDAYEHRDVATADIAGAYLHAFMKDFISMRFVGWAVDLLCDVNPSYQKYVVYENNTKVLYVRCNKAIYGCVVSGVLWYELFSDTLHQHGFTTNPYDFCIANATIEGSQCTIGWFVDDTKISHVNPDVVTHIISILETQFGSMKITRGNTHTFLGMHITYNGDGTASIHMPSYINEAITESGLSITSAAASPCTNSLLVIDPSSPRLPPAKAKSFHSIVAKLIYVGTRARTDILLALSFLCGRVAAPTEQDEQKLRRLLSYLYGTIDLPLRIGADSLSQFTTWVDASFAVHPDMRSHTGGVISFGRGGLICKSKKQNINTKSSTEAELIGASDYLPNTLYVKMFMEAQGYPITHAVFNQDNESAIKMEQNGKASCGQRSRHIDIRYFFITDHSKRNCIDITHCPTNDMLADFFTKPLQGALFRKFRSVLLGAAHIDSLSSLASSSPTGERVESKSPPIVSVPIINVIHPVDDTSYSVTNTDYLITTNNDQSNTNKNVNVNTSHSITKYPEDN